MATKRPSQSADASNSLFLYVFGTLFVAFCIGQGVIFTLEWRYLQRPSGLTAAAKQEITGLSVLSSSLAGALLPVKRIQLRGGAASPDALSVSSDRTIANGVGQPGEVPAATGAIAAGHGSSGGRRYADMLDLRQRLPDGSDPWPFGSLTEAPYPFLRSRDTEESVPVAAVNPRAAAEARATAKGKGKGHGKGKKGGAGPGDASSTDTDDGSGPAHGDEDGEEDSPPKPPTPRAEQPVTVGSPCWPSVRTLLDLGLDRMAENAAGYSSGSGSSGASGSGSTSISSASAPAPLLPQDVRRSRVRHTASETVSDLLCTFHSAPTGGGLQCCCQGTRSLEYGGDDWYWGVKGISGKGVVGGAGGAGGADSEAAEGVHDTNPLAGTFGGPGAGGVDGGTADSASAGTASGQTDGASGSSSSSGSGSEYGVGSGDLFFCTPGVVITGARHSGVGRLWAHLQGHGYVRSNPSLPLDTALASVHSVRASDGLFPRLAGSLAGHAGTMRLPQVSLDGAAGSAAGALAPLGSSGTGTATGGHVTTAARAALTAARKKAVGDVFFASAAPGALHGIHGIPALRQYFLRTRLVVLLREPLARVWDDISRAVLEEGLWLGDTDGNGGVFGTGAGAGTAGAEAGGAIGSGAAGSFDFATHTRVAAPSASGAEQTGQDSSATGADVADGGASAAAGPGPGPGPDIGVLAAARPELLTLLHLCSLQTACGDRSSSSDGSSSGGASNSLLAEDSVGAGMPPIPTLPTGQTWLDTGRTALQRCVLSGLQQAPDGSGLARLHSALKEVAREGGAAATPLGVSKCLAGSVGPGTAADWSHSYARWHAAERAYGRPRTGALQCIEVQTDDDGCHGPVAANNAGAATGPEDSSNAGADAGAGGCPNTDPDFGPAEKAAAAVLEQLYSTGGRIGDATAAAAAAEASSVWAFAPASGLRQALGCIPSGLRGYSEPGSQAWVSWPGTVGWTLSKGDQGTVQLVGAIRAAGQALDECSVTVNPGAAAPVPADLVARVSVGADITVGQLLFKYPGDAPAPAKVLLDGGAIGKHGRPCFPSGTDGPGLINALARSIYLRPIQRVHASDGPSPAMIFSAEALAVPESGVVGPAPQAPASEAGAAGNGDQAMPWPPHPQANTLAVLYGALNVYSPEYGPGAASSWAIGQVRDGSPAWRGEEGEFGLTDGPGYDGGFGSGSSGSSSGGGADGTDGPSALPHVPTLPSDARAALLEVLEPYHRALLAYAGLPQPQAGAVFSSWPRLFRALAGKHRRL